MANPNSEKDCANPRIAVLAGGMSIPVELVDDLPAVKRTLRVKFQPMGAEEPLFVEAFSLDEDNGYITVPRQYGLKLCSDLGIEWEDHTSPGADAHWPKIPKPRDYQHEFIDGLVDATEDYYDFLARAHTGFGKTISSLIAAARIATTTLIIVDQENLKDQWIEALTNLFGFKLADIGIIQGKECSYEGKAVSIAMVQSLTQKEYAQEMYDYFGLVIVDEVHVIGAPTFSAILRLFSASFRFGVSATPKRRDGLQKLLDYNLGKVRVAADKEHNESAVYYVKHDTVYSWYANISPKVGRFITEISEDGSRNLLLAETAIWLYETGRDVLILSDRIEQLKHLMSLCYYLGIPEEEMGLYTGTNPSYRIAKNPTPGRRPQGWERGTEYCAISLQLTSKSVPKKKLAAIKETSRMIFATYGMFAKGVDVPRLAAGLDGSPRGTAEQVHGRILREQEGKLKSIWVTVVDHNNYRACHSFAMRAKDYAKSNGRLFEWHADGGIEECHANEIAREMRERAADLQSQRIETTSDGRNTLVTQSSVMQSKTQAAKATVEAIRSRLARSPEACSRAGQTVKSRTMTSNTRSPSKASPSPKQPPRLARAKRT